MTPPFTPLKGRVLLEPVEPDRTTDSGLILVEDRKPETMGRVVAVAEPAYYEDLVCLREALSVAISLTDDPQLREAWQFTLDATAKPLPSVNVGDLVLFSWVSGQEILLDEARYLIMPEADILAVVEEHE